MNPGVEMMSFVLAYYAIMKKCMPMSEEKTGKKDYERLRVAAENLYIENGMDGREISKTLGVSEITVSRLSLIHI